MSRRSSSTSPPRTGSSSTTLPRSLVVYYFASAARTGASARRATRHPARRATRRRLLRQRRMTGCLSTSRGSSRSSLRRPLSTTSTTPRVRLPRHIVRLVAQLVVPPVVDYSASRRLVVDNSSLRRLAVDYFASAARPGASSCRAVRRLARCAARRRLLRLHHASRCLGMSRGPSRGLSSTTPCVMTSSCGHAGSTSATPCVVTTCLVATLDLLRVRRMPP
jgi:hypothetical protein